MGPCQRIPARHGPIVVAIPALRTGRRAARQAAYLPIMPLGSMTNFFAAPLSNSW